MKKLTPLLALVLVFVLAIAPFAYALDAQGTPQEDSKSTETTTEQAADEQVDPAEETALQGDEEQNVAEDPAIAEEEVVVEDDAAKLKEAVDSVGDIKPMATIQVSTANELQAAINASSPGDTIQLMSNIDIDELAIPFVNIPVDKNVILTGGFSLTSGGVTTSIGVRSGIRVSGTLVFDGVDYEFDPNSDNVAIDIQAGGHFTLKDGRIFGKSTPAFHSTLFFNNGFAVYNQGTFTMDGGEIAENFGAVYNRGSFIMNGGRIHSGSIGVLNISAFEMHDGEISNIVGNLPAGWASFSELGSAVSNDGIVNNGIVTKPSFTMYGGSINNNVSEFGGGVRITGNCDFTMYGGSITDNQANTGGGIYIEHAAVAIKILGGEIGGNHAVTGGGIYNTSDAANVAIEILDGEISGNHAVTGGGIYTSNHSTLKIGPNCTFSGNTADESDILDPTADPAAAAIYNANIQLATWSNGATYGYNDADINYTPSGVIPPTQQYTVTHNYNYSGAPAPTVIAVDSGALLGGATSQVTIPTRPGYTFKYWRFNADGTGVPDAATPVNSNLTLYAIWAPSATEVQTQAASALPATGDSSLYFVGAAALTLLAGGVLLIQRKRKVRSGE